MSQAQEVPEAVVLYRRLPNGTLLQYEIGPASAYMSIIEKDGTRALLKTYRITSQAAAIKDLPSGDPVPESDVPPEPPLLSMSVLDIETRSELGELGTEAPTTPQEAAASGLGRE